MKDKFPLKIVVGDQSKNRFKATTSLQKLSQRPENIRQDLAYLESDYSALMGTIREILGATTRGKGGNPRLFWLVGDSVVRFLERIDDMGFYLSQQNKTLARDVGISESSIKKMLSFRMRFRKLSMVDPTIPWAKYRDNKVPVPKRDS